MLCTIEAPHFVCSFDMRDDVVTDAAPIIRYMIGWSRDRVRGYAAKKGWQVRVCGDLPD